MNTKIFIAFFVVAFIATAIFGQESGSCIGGTCPTGYTCNSAGTCVGSSSTSCIGGTCPAGYTCNSAVTCVGSSSTCTDVASNCPVAYCNNALYRDLMSRQCRRTCGFC
uniref:ShKT domain-containing protein n=1 Tax=Panagrolaimus sp. ES5 TaxID=591445 RepID=A0AC34G5S4_9BILA